MIALCSKTYYLLLNPDDPVYDRTFGSRGEPDKIAAKGAQQNRNIDILNWDNYKRCLFDIVPIYGENSGIRYIDHHMQVYQQPKVILNSVYVKGIVMNDGLHIHPLIL